MNVRPTNRSGIKGGEGVGNNHARAIGPEKWINDALPSPVSTPKTATPSEFFFSTSKAHENCTRSWKEARLLACFFIKRGGGVADLS